MERNNSRKLIVCDLDGTLLNSKSQLSDRSINTVKSVISEGHIFCIATGRPKRGALEFYEKLGLDTIMVNINGSFMCKPHDNNFLPINSTYCKEIAKEIINNKEINDCATNIVIETADKEFILRKPHNMEIEKKILDVFHVDLNKHDEFKYLNNIENLDLDVNSILIIMRTETDVTRIRKIIKTISRTLVVRSWSSPVEGFNVMEINSLFASKGMALKFLSSYYSIPLCDTVAFGDGMNDLELLSKSHHSYAMKNAPDNVKLTASYDTDYSNNDDGVAVELERLFKI